MKKLLSTIIIAELLGLAISVTIKNKSLQSELDRAKENEVRTEWVKCAKEVQPLNNDIYGVNNGNK